LTTHAIAEGMLSARKKIDMCVDATAPTVGIKLEILKEAKIKAKKKGVRIRYITEITKDNISYCRELAEIVELRHLDNIQGNFGLSEREYCMAIAPIEKEKPVTQVIYSNAKQVIRQHHTLFETLWSKAIPAKLKIKEIEEGRPIFGRTEVLYGEEENAIPKGIEFMKNVKKTMDIYFDYLGPSIIIELDAYRNGFVEIRRRGGKIRALTEITDQNIHYCKDLLKMVNELRHLERLKGWLSVSETEMITTRVLQEAKPLTEVIHSNAQDFVQQGQYIFDALWNKAIPAEQKIKEIEEGIEPEFVEVITDGSKAARIIMEFARSVKNEALILMPHSKSMIRADKLGLWNYLVGAAEKGAQVRIICPLSDENSKIVKRLSDSSSNIKILNGQQTESGIFIADGRKYFSLEDRDVNAKEISEAISTMIYSNSKKGANLLRSFFDALWIQMDLYEKLKTHENAQKEFINIAAHELRTPIQPILGFAEVLRELIRKEPERAYIESILRNARRLQTLTEQILDVTRIESHRNLILKKELFDLNESIMTSIEDAKRYNDKLGLVVSTKFIYTPTDRIMVFADKSRIHQVLSNLLANAVKFNDKNGEVLISAERLDNEVVVKVKDTGCGLNSDILPKLFTKFMTKSDRGTGLGLYVSKYIIESHGGVIKGENNKDGKGATFTFVLPLEQRGERKDL
jgi:two-component system, OmpR family, sensor histidine kinase VicK